MKKIDVLVKLVGYYCLVRIWRKNSLLLYLYTHDLTVLTVIDGESDLMPAKQIRTRPMKMQIETILSLFEWVKEVGEKKVGRY